MKRLLCFLRGHRPVEQPWPREAGTPYDQTETATALRLGCSRFMVCERCGDSCWTAETGQLT